ncbi:hypothetical protein [Streptomyces sp. NPDC047042]|uniref:hypothetical protein n=1 Tax=Streptomyces sp. NPDC047042 TaxID=3154807 RepID=UPI0033F98D7E
MTAARLRASGDVRFDSKKAGLVHRVQLTGDMDDPTAHPILIEEGLGCRTATTPTAARPG